jgi:hypothetical protein
MQRRLLTVAAMVVAAAAGKVVGAQAQQPGGSALPATRAVAGRAEITTTLQEIEKILASPGYSSRLKATKRIEAELLRKRLTEGDFQTGDRVFVSVVGETALIDSFTVTAQRTLLIPNVAEFPLAGVLRSELQDYMTKQLSRFFKDPTVVTKAFIRLAVFGDVGAPGYYQLPADQLLGAAIMAAGGPTRSSRIEKTEVYRGVQPLWPKDAVRDAITRGITLDQFSLQAGDEIRIGSGGGVPFFQTARGIAFAIGSVTSLALLGARIF